MLPCRPRESRRPAVFRRFFLQRYVSHATCEPSLAVVVPCINPSTPLITIISTITTLITIIVTIIVIIIILVSPELGNCCN